jgi:nucleoside-diphosphate-sugar epimerase
VNEDRHVLITGGAGYIGAYLTGVLLREGYRVTVVDELLFGGEPLLAYLSHPKFHFLKADVWEARAIRTAVRNDCGTPCRLAL